MPNEPGARLRVVAIDHVVINATDADASARWYASALGKIATYQR